MNRDELIAKLMACPENGPVRIETETGHHFEVIDVDWSEGSPRVMLEDITEEWMDGALPKGRFPA